MISFVWECLYKGVSLILKLKIVVLYTVIDNPQEITYTNTIKRCV